MPRISTPLDPEGRRTSQPGDSSPTKPHTMPTSKSIGVKTVRRIEPREILPNHFTGRPFREAGGCPLAERVRVLVYFLVALLANAFLLAVPTTASAALVRPTYSVGDRWVYDLSGTLDALPGSNATSPGDLSFQLVGRLEVEVRGLEPRGVRVASVARGYLNGSFSLPPPFGGTVTVTGSFAADGTELWEGQNYFPIESNGTTTYSADITFIVTSRMNAMIRANANTTVGPGSVFPLEVGNSSTVDLSTTLRTNSTFTFLGNTTTSENTTTGFTSWKREVLALETVSVGAGSFASYKLNQSLGSFPGFVSAGGAAGGNETAYFSNDVGYYTKRVGYANGTPVAEANLRSYAYGARASYLIPILLIVLAAVVSGIVFALWYRRRKKRATSAPPTPSSPPNEVEHAR